MSVAEVVRECHQGFQSPKVIEEMLRDSDKRQCYLTWQSEIRDKSVYTVLCYSERSCEAKSIRSQMLR